MEGVVKKRKKINLLWIVLLDVTKMNWLLLRDSKGANDTRLDWYPLIEGHKSESS